MTMEPPDSTFLTQKDEEEEEAITEREPKQATEEPNDSHREQLPPQSDTQRNNTRIAHNEPSFMREDTSFTTSSTTINTTNPYTRQRSLLKRESSRISIAYDPHFTLDTPYHHQPSILYLLPTTTAASITTPSPDSHQHLKEPHPPLKAWRGYGGNVYFEPINYRPVTMSGASNSRFINNPRGGNRNNKSRSIHKVYSQKAYPYREPFETPRVHYDSVELQRRYFSGNNQNIEEKYYMEMANSLGSLSLKEAPPIRSPSRAACSLHSGNGDGGSKWLQTKPRIGSSFKSHFVLMSN